MKTIIKISSLLLVASLAACSTWLDVQPRDKVDENEVFSSELKINEALNGLYLRMGREDLYGKNLTFYAPEVLAQRYWILPTASEQVQDKALTDLIQMKAERKEARELIDRIYAGGYNAVLGINNFIRRMSEANGVVSDWKKDIMLGEAYALRAYLHLDMLRMFGPVPTDKPDAPSVPYVKVPDNKWQPLKTHREIVTLILEDIETALGLLGKDAVLTEGVVTGDDSDDDDPDFFYNDYRNRRLNYYAVQALKVRTLMYSGIDTNIQAAGLLAKTLIEDPAFKKAFPWSKQTEVYSKDRVFSDEVLFGIYVPDMYSEWEKWFSPGRENIYILLPFVHSNVAYMFGRDDFRQSGDWRSIQYVDWPDNTSERYLMSARFQNTSYNPDVQYFQPLVRKSEVFLAAAEVLQDEQYIDSVRVNRGLIKLSEEFGAGGFDLQEQIGKEYMKDMQGEGQLLYYYKRRNMDKIRGYDGGEKEVTPNNYIMPLPEKEVNI